MYSEIEIISYSTVRGLRLPMESQRAATRAQVIPPKNINFVITIGVNGTYSFQESPPLSPTYRRKNFFFVSG